MSIKKKKRKIRHQGKWFVPNSKLQLQGELLIDNECYDIKLRLFSNTDFYGNDIIKSRKQNYEIIYGHCEFESRITLNNCRLKSATSIGESLYEIIIESSICYYGGIWKDSDNLKIVQLTCTYPYFSSWFDTNRNYFGSLSSDSSIGALDPAISQNDLFDEIKINDDLKIIVERRYEDFNLPLTKEAKIEVKHFIHFMCNSPKTLNEFRKYAHKLMQLIKLSTGKLIYTDFVSLVAHTDDILEYDKHFLGRDNKLLISISKFNNIQKRQLISSDYIHQNNMLFYGGSKTNERLKLVIVNWFKNYENYSSVYNTFLDSMEWFQNTDAFLTEVMFNNRLVNLVQGIENYYFIAEKPRMQEIENELKLKINKIIETIPSKEDSDFLGKHIQYHEVLRHKLKYLIFKKFDLISNEIFFNKDDKKGYIHKLKEFRDKVSHGEQGDFDIEKTYDYYYKTLIILISCILDTLNLTQEDIIKNLLRSLKYGNIIHLIKSKMDSKI